MSMSTLQDWVGAWKELKQWCLQKTSGKPAGIQEGGIYYDTDTKVPMYFDGTEERPFAAYSDHNDLANKDGGDPVNGYFGHMTLAEELLLANAGGANGVAVLNSLGYLPIGVIPESLLGAVRYQGTWNATSNTPALSTTPATDTKGFYYVVSTAGTWNSMTFSVGDWVISNGSAWQRVDNVDAVVSV